MIPVLVERSIELLKELQSIPLIMDKKVRLKVGKK